MKNQSELAIQFSGYPLAVVSTPELKFQSKLKLVKKEIDLPTTAIQRNSISTDPTNWDESWFNGYE